MFYVYMYIDPRNYIPFYIGKGSGDRIYKHLKETKENTENRKKYAKIEGLRNCGLEPIITKVFETASEADAYDYETKLIQQYGRMDIDTVGCLTNICIDNRPPRNISRKGKKTPSTPAKRLADAAKRGKTYTELYGVDRAIEIRKKQSGRSGIKNHFFGKKHSNETKERLAVIRKGSMSPMTGKKHTVKSKQKIQLNNTRRRSIHTPTGVYASAEEYATIHNNNITPNGLRGILKHQKIISTKTIAKCRLFTKEDIGKIPRDLGFYYL